METVKAGIFNFALVFGTGLVLGTIRTLWITPRLGKRRAELPEAPLILTATVLAARWRVAHLLIASMPSARAGMGSIALGVMLVAEFGPMLWLRGFQLKSISVRETAFRERCITQYSGCSPLCRSSC